MPTSVPQAFQQVSEAYFGRLPGLTEGLSSCTAGPPSLSAGILVYFVRPPSLTSGPPSLTACILGVLC